MTDLDASGVELEFVDRLVFRLAMEADVPSATDGLTLAHVREWTGPEWCADRSRSLVDGRKECDEESVLRYEGSLKTYQNVAIRDRRVLPFLRSRLPEAGMGIVEVIIAIALFMIIMTPIMYLILGSGHITGDQRAKAVAAQIAAQVATNPPVENSQSVVKVSGIAFQTQAKSRLVCESLDSDSSDSVKIPMKEVTVVVTWAKQHSLSVAHWYPASGAC